MMMAAVLMFSVASAQQKKAPTFGELATKAAAAGVITADEKSQMLEINQKANKAKEDVKKSGKDEAERKAENKKIDTEKTAEFKKVLGDKWADFAKFRDGLNKGE
ncbi:hypothetical protein FACS1894159_05630 [Bacteroidia bacterium]|nr:hypothetical protein FACS1894159_05630 [Bacteroidia bacterium]